MKDFTNTADRPESDAWMDQEIGVQSTLYTKDQLAMLYRVARIEKLKKLFLKEQKIEKKPFEIPTFEKAEAWMKRSYQARFVDRGHVKVALPTMVPFQSTFESLLSQTDQDSRGVETPLNAFGQTALGLTVDPAYWSKLNDSEINVLISIDRIEYLLQSKCSWTRPDKRGIRPIDTCPFWLKKIFVSTYRNLQKYEHLF